MQAALVFLLFLFPLTVASVVENATVVDPGIEPETKNITDDVSEVKKIVLYGRIFCAQQQEVHSRQKRFNSLSDLYSAHGYSGSTPDIQMRSDDDDEVVSDWERLSNQIKNNDHQLPQLRSGGKKGLHRSSDYYPANNYPSNNYPSYPSSGEQNYKPYYQEEHHYEPEESYSSEEESHFAQYPTEEYQKSSGEYHHVPKHNKEPKKWEGKPQKETWSDKQQQVKPKPDWEKEEKPKPDWEKEEKPKPDWEKEEKPVQVVKGEWNGQPTEHHQPQTPQIQSQPIGWNEPKKESEQQSQAAVKPVEVEHSQKMRQSNVLQAHQFNGFNQQQSGVLPPTTHSENMELANNDWAIDPFISGGAGLTRAEQQEQQQQQSNQQNGSPKWSQPIEARQRRSADEPAVSKEDKTKLDLEPVKKALVTAYQSKAVGFSRVNEPIARAETDEDGYFRLEITLENDNIYSSALPYFSIAHQCPNVALPKLEENCRYINYQLFDQANPLSEENSFAKVVILGVGDQKQTTVRCPLGKEAPSFMNE